MEMNYDEARGKRLLLLGGSRYLLPAIEAAHNMGVYVITCDYLPDNLAHPYADEYCNVSIVDKEAVLEAAKRLHVDGIMSYATDPGVATAAYVAEKLGLPTSPYESVAILQNKGRFRAFLREHGFTVPETAEYASLEECREDLGRFRFPLMVKPVDSAGSKGVTRIGSPAQLPRAVETALGRSICKRFIAEEFIEKAGFSTDTDCFSKGGELVFCSFDDQWFDEKAANPYTPAAYTWPATMPMEKQKELRGELQRLIRLLGMKTTIYNVETRVGKDGRAYLMEVSPRAGGNRLAELLRMASGQDLITASVLGALGLDRAIPPLSDPVYSGHWGEIILHSEEAGVFRRLELADEIRPYVQETDLWVQEGDRVERFTGANETIGTLVLRAESSEKLRDLIRRTDELVRVVTEPAAG